MLPKIQMRTRGATGYGELVNKKVAPLNMSGNKLEKSFFLSTVNNIRSEFFLHFSELNNRSERLF